MEQILSFDYALFEWINHDWQNDFFDIIMPYWRDKKSWIPAYLLMLVLLGWKYRLKAVYFFLFLLLTVGISDQLSSELIKKTVKRDRPCRTVDLMPPANTLIHCGGGYSFPSSHATNHFAVAVFLVLTWAKLWGKWKYFLLLWAASISIGQVYVGVHFPIDITFGAILGSLVAFATSNLYKKIGKYRIDVFC